MKKVCTLLTVAMAFWANGIDAQYTTSRWLDAHVRRHDAR